MTHFEVIAFSISFSAKSSAEPLAVHHVGVDVLPCVFLQIPFLGKPFPSPFANVGLDTLVHADMVK